MIALDDPDWVDKMHALAVLAAEREQSERNAKFEEITPGSLWHGRKSGRRCSVLSVHNNTHVAITYDEVDYRWVKIDDFSRLYEKC